MWLVLNMVHKIPKEIGYSKLNLAQMGRTELTVYTEVPGNPLAHSVYHSPRR